MAKRGRPPKSKTEVTAVTGVDRVKKIVEDINKARTQGKDQVDPATKIEKLKQEKERLEQEKKMLEQENEVAELEAEIERLKKENEELRRKKIPYIPAPNTQPYPGTRPMKPAKVVAYFAPEDNGLHKVVAYFAPSDHTIDWRNSTTYAYGTPRDFREKRPRL